MYRTGEPCSSPIGAELATFSQHERPTVWHPRRVRTPAMRNGLDRLATDAALAARVRGAKLGLVAHPASVTRELVHVRHVLDAIGARPRIVFGPEHGYGGEAQDMIGVGDGRDAFGTPAELKLYW